MTHDQAHTLLAAALHEIAPDVDLGALDPDAPFQEEADLDSMDFLNIVIFLHDETGIDIPEADYPRLATVNGVLEYLESRGADVA